MKQPMAKGTLSNILGLLLIGAWGFFFALGVQHEREVYATPAQVASGEIKQMIPLWVAGTVDSANDELFTLHEGNDMIFVQFAGTLPTAGQEILVLGRLPTGHRPPCTPSRADCPFEARTLLPKHSWWKYFYMGGYGFFVWVSYGLALIILVVNFIVPRQQEQYVLRSLARQQRRKRPYES